MRDSSFVLLFDVSRQGYQAWREALLPAVVTLVALALALMTRKVVSDGQQPRLLLYSRVASIIAGIGLLGFVASLMYTWDEFSDLRQALNSGAYRITTGAVTELIPERLDGHPPESFRVNGVRFEYSSSQVTSGFHRTVGVGGPLREGLSVRIADVDGKIVRFEALTKN